jgi:hypothetical protein
MKEKYEIVKGLFGVKRDFYIILSFGSKDYDILRKMFGLCEETNM